MAVAKYQGILDDGRRCKSCCNRSNLFGYILAHGREGDCTLCSLRWHRAHFMNACRGMRKMILSKNLFGLHAEASEMILQYANLDLRFFRKAIDFGRHSRMLKDTWTHISHSVDEYFGVSLITVWRPQFDSMTVNLSEEALTSVAVQREILRDLPRCTSLSLLDVVASFLMKPAKESYAGLTAYVQERDYTKTRWKPGYQNHEAILENEMTGERMNQTTLHEDWVRYKFNGAYWWLENIPAQKKLPGKRWFWCDEVVPEHVHGERFERDRFLMQNEQLCKTRFPPWLDGELRRLTGEKRLTSAQ
jgi:hypothetical protein